MRILDQKTGQFRPLNRLEQKQERERQERITRLLKEQREWKDRARQAERAAVDDPTAETISASLKAFADWHEYGRPSRASNDIASQARRLAKDGAYCADIAAHWSQFHSIRIRHTRPYAGFGIRAPWYFEHELTL